MKFYAAHLLPIYLAKTNIGIQYRHNIDSPISYESLNENDRRRES